jgi:Uncharacterized alpha/beta hydrolase domain (DUF2235)
VSPQVATPFAAKISKALDEAVAWNLQSHVMGMFMVFWQFTRSLIMFVSSDGYEFLMQSCMESFHFSVASLIIHIFLDKSGDRICIFGFSRGAYTARGLAGMIHKVYMPTVLTDCTDV